MKPDAYLADAEMRAASTEGLEAGRPAREVRRAGVIGAGVMGAGITTALSCAGVSVTLIDQSRAAVDRGLSIVRENLARMADRGRLSTEDASRFSASVVPAVEVAAVGGADLVIEAVWENLDLKRSIFADVGRNTDPGALLGTNTSTLDIDAIAGATGRPEDVVGLHFFSPAHVMRLLEIVRGARTADATIVDALALARRMDKIPVVVGNAYGFVGNRLLGAREAQAKQLLLEGALPQDVDRVLMDFGFAMGPFTMQDMSGGIELMWRMRQETGETDPVGDRLAELGRFGQKSGKGYYAYGADGRTPIPDPEVEQIIVEAAHGLGIGRRAIGDDEIRERLIYPMINEGAKLLSERIAARPSDIDVVWSRGYGWPREKAGPMFHADKIGARTVRDRLLALQQVHGDVFAPAPLLAELADRGGRFRDAMS